MKKYINILFALALIFGLAACSADFEDFGNSDYVDEKDYSGQEYTTVSFVGNGPCFTPDIRYMTCVIHDDKVKARIHTGRKTDTLDGNQERTVVFDLPSASTESGTIEFSTDFGSDNAGKVTYQAKWERKRYDVRISEITIKSDTSE